MDENINIQEEVYDHDIHIDADENIDIQEEVYSHYIRLDADENIIHGFSDSSEQPLDGDICINEQGGYQYKLFAGGEENPQLFNAQGMWLYRYIDGEVISKSPEEIQAELEALPKPTPAPTIKELEALTYYVGMMTGVL